MGAALASRCASDRKACDCASDRKARSEARTSPANGPPVEFTVRMLTGLEVAVLNMPEDSTILDVKCQLALQQNVPAYRQRLLHENRVLCDEETLQDVGTPDDLMYVELHWKSDEDQFAIGDLVQLHHDGNVVFQSLSSSNQEWMPDMNRMLGRTFEVKSVPSPGFVSVPSPVNTSTVTFPESVVRKGETLAEGDIVRTISNSRDVKHAFERIGYIWDARMDSMLGKEYPILEMTKKGIIALPSPDGSQNGKWYFPVSVVQKVTGDNEEILPYEGNESTNPQVLLGEQ